MDTLVYYSLVALFGIVLFFGWCLTLLGFPGNWLMVAASAAFAAFFSGRGAHGITWTTVGVLVLIAAIGEGAEMISGAAGIAKGGTKRGALCALVGSFLGSAVGIAISVPIPFVGPVLGVVAGAALGAMGGTVLGERTGGKSVSESVRLGKVAFWGRLAGTISKIGIGCMIAAVAFFAALL